MALRCEFDWDIRKAAENPERFMEEALSGEVVSITRNRKTVVHLAPIGAPDPTTPEYLADLRSRRGNAPDASEGLDHPPVSL